MCILFCTSVNVLAFSENSGNITVRIPSLKGENVENIKVSINKVADIVDGQYVLKSDFKNVNVDLNKMENGESYKKAAESFCRAIDERTDRISLYTDSKGEIKAEGLEEGVYIVSSKGNENTGKLSAAIISVPQWDELSDTARYNIICEPKRSIKSYKTNMIKEEIKTPKTGDDKNVYYALGSLTCSIIFIILQAVLSKRHKALDNK